MMKVLLILLIFVSVILQSEAQKIEQYESITIGNQVWMKKNLNVDNYRNGDPIPEVKKSYEWAKLKTGAWCYYDNKPENGAIYGKLYNWYAVIDPRGLAPEGWHIPTDKEWQELVEYVGGLKIAGGILKESGTTHWLSPNEGATNESEFSALPGGLRVGNGTFYNLGLWGYWWSMSGNDVGDFWCRVMGYWYAEVNRYSGYYMGDGYSVRCVRD